MMKSMFSTTAWNSNVFFERELVEISNAHFGLVCPSSDGMVAVARALDAVARLGELKVLQEPYGALDMLVNCVFALGLGGAFSYEPIR